ncbi:MAG: hypothetical protein ACKO5A_06110 [Actinomycetota bacterium]|nr:hypothetical protein [Actinomycetota bacterium]
MPDVDSIRERLETIAEELADLVLEGLRSSIDAGRSDPGPEERRLARARRSVEKAAALLRTDESE